MSAHRKEINTAVNEQQIKGMKMRIWHDIRYCQVFDEVLAK